jgi:hypothetical protein
MEKFGMSKWLQNYSRTGFRVSMRHITVSLLGKEAS